MSLAEVLTKLENLEKKMDKIQETLEEIKSGTDNMTGHINFVENVYSVVKNPFRQVLKLYYRNNDNELELLDSTPSKRLKN